MPKSYKSCLHRSIFLLKAKAVPALIRCIFNMQQNAVKVQGFDLALQVYLGTNSMFPHIRARLVKSYRLHIAGFFLPSFIVTPRISSTVERSKTLRWPELFVGYT